MRFIFFGGKSEGDFFWREKNGGKKILEQVHILFFCDKFTLKKCFHSVGGKIVEQIHIVFVEEKSYFFFVTNSLCEIFSKKKMGKILEQIHIKKMFPGMTTESNIIGYHLCFFQENYFSRLKFH